MNVKLILHALFWFFYGVAVHDYAHALWQVGGYGEMLSLQGGWIGFAGVAVAFVAMNRGDYLRALSRLHHSYLKRHIDHHLHGMTADAYVAHPDFFEKRADEYAEKMCKQIGV